MAKKVKHMFYWFQEAKHPLERPAQRQGLQFWRMEANAPYRQAILVLKTACLKGRGFYPIYRQ